MRYAHLAGPGPALAAQLPDRVARLGGWLTGIDSLDDLVAAGPATMLPGDLVLTGTPAGVGAFRTPPVFLAPGDVVEVEVEGIGVLCSPVAAMAGVAR